MPEDITPTGKLPVPASFIERRIYLIRGQKVMLDGDLTAALDGFHPSAMLPAGVRKSGFRTLILRLTFL